MPDDSKLTPATATMSKSDFRWATQAAAPWRGAAETMSKVVAERLAAELEASSFVIMRKPIPNYGAGDNPGMRGFEG
jgi:hypothetical protein